jgi:gliding motility-associated-like protein
MQTIMVAQPTALSVSVNSTAVCPGLTGSETVSVNGGVSNYSFLWSNGQTTPTILDLLAGIYTVTVTDGNGCSLSVNGTVAVSPNPVASAGSDTSIAIGGSASLNSSGGTSYLWIPSSYLSCTTCTNPVATPPESTTYCVIVGNGAGCRDTACVRVTVGDVTCGEPFIPSAFSPNGDGQNEFECFYGNCIQSFKFEIYDRWGEKVFETTDQKICWDGKYNGKQMNSGVYVYALDAVKTTGEKIKMKGNITLFR